MRSSAKNNNDNPAFPINANFILFLPIGWDKLSLLSAYLPFTPGYICCLLNIYPLFTFSLPNWMQAPELYICSQQVFLCFKI
jgi:hypothetical protein